VLRRRPAQSHRGIVFRRKMVLRRRRVYVIVVYICVLDVTLSRNANNLNVAARRPSSAHQRPADQGIGLYDSDRRKLPSEGDHTQRSTAARCDQRSCQSTADDPGIDVVLKQATFSAEVLGGGSRGPLYTSSSIAQATAQSSNREYGDAVESSRSYRDQSLERNHIPPTLAAATNLVGLAS